MSAQKAVKIAIFILLGGLLAASPIFVYAQTATTSATTTAATSATASTSTAATTTAPVATSTPPVINTNAGVEAQVRSYFASEPVMIAIASCESSFRQFDSSGNPLSNGSGDVVGIFQISSSSHAAIALSMGMNIDTVAGNMAYANYLYQKEGTDPWISSFACWDPMVNPTASTSAPTQSNTASPALYSNLVLGAVSPEVMTLQELLNKTTTPVATSGPGSPGQETDVFGTLTKIAVQAFQCAHNIVCTGDEYTTGYGALGPATRAALLEFSGNLVAAVPVPDNTTPLPGSAAATSTTVDDSAEIAQLQAEIVQLEAILAALIKARSS
jgi:hypothetical protein